MVSGWPSNGGAEQWFKNRIEPIGADLENRLVRHGRVEGINFTCLGDITNLIADRSCQLSRTEVFAGATKHGLNLGTLRTT